MELWTPDTERNRRRETAGRFTADLLSQSAQLDRLKHLEGAVKAIDPHCSIVKADDAATHPALKPGYWCVLRNPPVGLPSVVIHEGPNGEYRELDSGILDTLRSADMWSAERQRDRERMAKQAKRAQEREEAREREDRVKEITERLKATDGISVLMPRGV